MPTRRILLVRHGHYERVNNLGDLVWSLSPLGRAQATRTGQRLARLLPTYGDRFEGIFSSPWPRAAQTAELIAHELGLRTVRLKPYLHECPALVPEEDARTRAMGLRPTTAEDRAATTAQIERIRVRFLRAPRVSSTVILVAHGNLIRYLVASALDLPWEMWMRMEHHHAGITELRAYSSTWCALIHFNETGHFSPELLSSQ